MHTIPFSRYELVAIASVMGLACGGVARRKGYSFLIWWLAGSLALFVALPIVCWMKPHPRGGRPLGVKGSVVLVASLAFLYVAGGIGVALARGEEGLARAGDPVAQTHVGLAYWRGVGKPKDIIQALAWYEAAAKQGYPAAAIILGQIYRDGDQVPRQPERAIHFLRIAADKGSAVGQYQLAGLLDKRDRATANRYLKLAAEGHLPMAEYTYGYALLEALTAKEALPWLERAAEPASAEQLELAKRPQLAAEDEPAVKLARLRITAPDGLPEAQYTLGLMHEDGRGTKKDAAEAAKWFALAAAHHSAPAAKALAASPQREEGRRRARAWLKERGRADLPG